MRKILIGVFVTVVIVFFVQYCEHERESRMQLQQNSSLIQKQLNNVGKLIVTEGNFAQVYTYEDWKKLYFDFLSAKKKALVIVNAKAQISYDLSKIEIRIDEENRTVTIVKIPDPEVAIFPDIEYYDVQQEYFNQFDAEDYNKIKKQVSDSIRKVVESSSLVSNAENRLLSELQKIYILTNSMGWILEYKSEVIDSESELLDLKL